MSDESWTVRARLGRYTATEAASKPFPMDWAIEGLLPATGATVWFGSGSTGKTQLLLWLAAHVAARGERRPRRWLGAEVKAQGQILVLSAEDLREHLFQRIGSIVRWMDKEMSGVEIDVEDVCSRIHVMPFLSMSMREFTELNPSLFGRSSEGRWEPSTTLRHIETFLDDWNDKATLEGRPEDRFVGVILDSAVSMAGFEMAQSEATTNFLFHLNRMSRRQKMFWAIIGHTPKDAAKKTDEPSVERLRGSAMWSTTPRTVVEVRTAGSTDNVQEVLARYPELDVRDVVFVSTAKANSVGADLRPRALRRVKDGAFVDISAEFPSVFTKAGTGVPDFAEKRTVCAPADPAVTWLAIVDIIEYLTDGGQSDIAFTRTMFQDEFTRRVASNPALTNVGPEVEGKNVKAQYSLAWYLYRLKDVGAIQQKQQRFVADLSRAKKRVDPAMDAEELLMRSDLDGAVPANDFVGSSPSDDGLRTDGVSREAA